jgi:hypothetical protein
VLIGNPLDREKHVAPFEIKGAFFADNLVVYIDFDWTEFW